MDGFVRAQFFAELCGHAEDDLDKLKGNGALGRPGGSLFMAEEGELRRSKNKQ